MTLLSISSAKGKTKRAKMKKSANKKRAEVNINPLIFSFSPFLEKEETNLVTEEDTPKLAKLAKEDVDRTIDQTPSSSTFNFTSKSLYNKK